LLFAFISSDNLTTVQGAKLTPRLYEKQSENLELKAAIAKATAAANATNNQKYPQPQMNNNPSSGTHRNQP
jgi:hypothetical protein